MEENKLPDDVIKRINSLDIKEELTKALNNLDNEGNLRKLSDKQLKLIQKIYTTDTKMNRKERRKYFVLFKKRIKKT